MRLREWFSPTLEDHQTMPVGKTFAGVTAAEWTLALLCFVRATSALVAFFAPFSGAPASVDRLWLAALESLVGVILLSSHIRVADWFLQATIAMNVAAVAWTIATAPQVQGAAVNLFGLVGIGTYVGAWFTARQAGLHMLAATLASAIAMAARPDPAAFLPLWITGVLTAFILSLLLHVLMRHQARLAGLDPLTGVLTRSGLASIIDRPTVTSRLRQPLSVAVLDLDGFKAINDLQGHEAGDRLLRAVGEQLRQGTRDTDVVARLGGDEFLILLGGTSAFRAEEIITRLVTLLPISASFGVAAWPTGGDFDAVLRTADAAMYSRKPQTRPTSGRETATS